MISRKLNFTVMILFMLAIFSSYAVPVNAIQVGTATTSMAYAGVALMGASLVAGIPMAIGGSLLAIGVITTFMFMDAGSDTFSEYFVEKKFGNVRHDRPRKVIPNTATPIEYLEPQANRAKITRQYYKAIEKGDQAEIKRLAKELQKYK